MTNISPCRFCHQPPIYAPLQEMERVGVKVFFCFTCYAEYLHHATGNVAKYEPYAWSLYATVNGKVYRCTIGSGYCHLWHVQKPGVPGVKANQDLTTVCYFPLNEDGSSPVNITPDNMADKIKRWLPFL